MDFIKIPSFIANNTVRDIAIRISDISAVTTRINKDDKTEIAVIYLKNNTQIKSPMSVAKIYDLIWQVELSNQVRHERE